MVRYPIMIGMVFYIDLMLIRLCRKLSGKFCMVYYCYSIQHKHCPLDGYHIK